MAPEILPSFMVLKSGTHLQRGPASDGDIVPLDAPVIVRVGKEEEGWIEVNIPKEKGTRLKGNYYLATPPKS